MLKHADFDQTELNVIKYFELEKVFASVEDPIFLITLTLTNHIYIIYYFVITEKIFLQ